MASTSNFSSYFSGMSQIPMDQKIRAALEFNNLSRSTKEILTKVYTTLAIGIITATIGVAFSISFYRPSFIMSLVMVLASAFAFATTPKHKMETRLILFNVVTFVTGMVSSGMIEMYMNINPALVLTAFMATCGIFISFTLFSLLTDKRMFIFIGSSLASLSIGILVLSLSRLFGGYSETVDQLLTLGFLASAVMFVIFDTQIMVYRIENNGDKDFIHHAFILFFDFVDLMRVILRVLAKKEEKNSKKSKR